MVSINTRDLLEELRSLIQGSDLRTLDRVAEVARKAAEDTWDSPNRKNADEAASRILNKLAWSADTLATWRRDQLGYDRAISGTSRDGERS